jgi:membrane associated rhomboid family serine protease
MSALTPAVRTLLFANVSFFVLQAFVDPVLRRFFALWPLGTIFQPWQVITYAFLHGGFGHIFFNMLALFMFGRHLEALWGTRRFVQFYFASVLAAALAQLAVTSYTGAIYPTIGASGGVFGLLLAYALFFPHERIMLLFPPIPLPAWLFVTLYGLLTLFMGVTGTAAGVAHFAHLGGMVGGALTLWWWRSRGPLRRP